VYLSDRPPVIETQEDIPGRVALGPSHRAPRVEGTVRLRTGRLLYVDTDFVLYGEETPVRLTESRKVKLKELHYFDHPLYGVLLQVTPYHRPQKLAPFDETASEEN
jgi:hypothetical protein